MVEGIHTESVFGTSLIFCGSASRLSVCADLSWSAVAVF